MVGTISVGDTFCEYSFSHITNHNIPEVALRKAFVASRISTTRSGAFCSVPLLSEVDKIALSVLLGFIR